MVCEVSDAGFPFCCIPTAALGGERDGGVVRGGRGGGKGQEERPTDGAHLQNLLRECHGPGRQSQDY